MRRSSSQRQQQRLTTFFGGSSSNPSSSRKRPRAAAHNPQKSSFANCPICSSSIPWHRLEAHASECNGVVPVVRNNKSKNDTIRRGKREKLPSLDDDVVQHTHVIPATPSPSTVGSAAATIQSTPKSSSVSSTKASILPSLKYTTKKSLSGMTLQPTSEPIPGLFLFEDFISPQEEQDILTFLDAGNDDVPWKAARFNGKHIGKRWGVHCNLRDKRVDAPEHPLPDIVFENIILPKLAHVQSMKECIPNEANAIDYRRKQGHWLQAHVDDRKLSKEPIANLSLAGPCIMTYTNMCPHRNTANKQYKILLKPRCLQVLTSKARYDFSHAIANDDLFADRRVSLTMRESPLTGSSSSKLVTSVKDVFATSRGTTRLICATGNKAATVTATSTTVAMRQISSTSSTVSLPAVSSLNNSTTSSSFTGNMILQPSSEPIPGLFLFEDFISPQEEQDIMSFLDGRNDAVPWKLERFSGRYFGKRWGVHCNHRDKRVDAPEHPLPEALFQNIILPKLAHVQSMKECIPNEANAIDYRRKQGHWLQAHADDRQLSKEPIANLSLAGPCIMTFTNMCPRRNTANMQYKILLKPRCLQVLTSKARYDFSHAIANDDLLVDRRLSLTMRESPLTGSSSNKLTTTSSNNMFTSTVSHQKQKEAV